ncbi:FAD/NAD P-binding domain-containing protein [Gloeophyllum trabeum ATCC 11539]|uniref:FAD/NAD P-binding domain-containing protein n=1 Tax=Gloeophyllum trabeum (strain ATCC 11539 / FP-39264 / Madison 617) TaxID=670483 RepID=S7PZ38_GLOTA|nr:FAD/NAD P-binding domain-containing protein [Gloeophyllum trabeum ATCC 11539]EPQ52911.1 FAD/NAD P-binding domain-containing protein [Gloeophyllum trabeum ATCC 11539]
MSCTDGRRHGAPTKTVAVLGASFGGKRFHAARILANGLPEDWRVVLIDRNSHVNHLYVFPRYAVLAGHEHKAFIPPSHVFPSPPHTFLHALVTALSPYSLTYQPLASPLSHGARIYECAHPSHGLYTCPAAASPHTLHFDYLVYALGSRLPAPIDLWGDERERRADDLHQAQCASFAPTSYKGTKAAGIAYLKRMQERVRAARSVLVVGGGALGIQFASDIAALYPSKHVTLLHSRQTLLPRFEEELGRVVLSALSSLGVNVILGERVDLSTLHTERHQVKPAHQRDQAEEEEERVVKTVKGREVRAELVLLCTGQTPNTALLASFLPDAIVPAGARKGMARVRRSLQVAVPRRVPALDDDDDDDTLDVPHPHLFAIGDAADAFGALNAGHNAHWQAEVAARNILRLVRGAHAHALEAYAPGPPAIKVSLGLTDAAYQINGAVGTKTGCAADLDARGMWQHFGWREVREEDLVL